LATYWGLAHYNGSSWNVYTKNTSGIPDNRLLAVAIESNGDKWVESENGGLVKY
jgi:hypothetical protein